VAISALPPLNGFVSEWLTFQAILLSPQLPHWGLKFTVPAAGALLALSAALAAACFVRAFGMTFLGRARTPVAANAAEVDRFSRAAMFVFAGLCFLVGILPGLVIDGLAPVVQDLVGARMPVQLASPWLSIVPVIESRSSYNGLLVFLFGLLTASLAAWVIHRVASNALRRAPPWDCGYPWLNPRMQDTAEGFGQPVRQIFEPLYRMRRELPTAFDARPRYAVEVGDPLWHWLYLPVARAVEGAARGIGRLQQGRIAIYLAYSFATVIAILVWVTL
jgi:hypothetical protein